MKDEPSLSIPYAGSAAAGWHSDILAQGRMLECESLLTETELRARDGSIEALEALGRASGGDFAEIFQPVDFSEGGSNPDSEDSSNLNKGMSMTAGFQLDCSADLSTPENSSAMGSSRPAKKMKWRERARNRRPRPPVSALENPVGNGSAVTSTCTLRPLEFVGFSETGALHQGLLSVSSPNVLHNVQEQEVGQSLQALAAGPEIPLHPLQEELQTSAKEANNGLSSQVRLSDGSSPLVEPVDVGLSRGPFCPSPNDHIQASDVDVVNNQPWRDLADQFSSVFTDRSHCSPPQPKQNQKLERHFRLVTHSRGLKRIRPDDLTSSLLPGVGPPPKTAPNKRQKAPVRRPKHHAMTTQATHHVEPADDNAELPLDVRLQSSGPDAEACESSSYLDLLLCDSDSLLSPERVYPAVPTHMRQKFPIRRPHVPVQAGPVAPDTLPLCVPLQGMPQPNGPANANASGPSNEVFLDSLSPPSPVEFVLSESTQVPDGLLQRPSGEEFTAQQERRAECKPNMRQLRSQVSRKLKAWGLKARLLQGGDKTGAHHGNGEERLLMSEAQRDAFVGQMVKSCRRDHGLRATFLDAVKGLAEAGVLQTSASQLLSQGPSDTSEGEVNAWKEISACSPPDCSSSPKPLLNLYKEVDLLHKEGESAMQNLVALKEDDPSLCSLHQTSYGAWELKMPVSQKREKASKPGL